MVTTTQHRQIDWDWTERPRLISTAPPTSLALSRFLLFLRRDCLNRVSFNQQPATRFPAPSTCLGSVLLCNVWKIPLVVICPNKARHLSYWNPYKPYDRHGWSPWPWSPSSKPRFGLHSLALRGIVLALRSGRHLCGSNLHLLTVGNAAMVGPWRFRITMLLGSLITWSVPLTLL